MHVNTLLSDLLTNTFRMLWHSQPSAVIFRPLLTQVLALGSLLRSMCQLLRDPTSRRHSLPSASAHLHKVFQALLIIYVAMPSTLQKPWDSPYPTESTHLKRQSPNDNTAASDEPPSYESAIGVELSDPVGAYMDDLRQLLRTVTRNESERSRPPLKFPRGIDKHCGDDIVRNEMVVFLRAEGIERKEDLQRYKGMAQKRPP